MSRLLLGIDTATASTTVALVLERDDGGADVLAERSHRDARRHGEVLPGLIVDTLDAASVTRRDVDAVAVGVGPGAYTGLRVGIATAQALGLGLAVPVIGAVTLDAIAFGTHRAEPFVVVTDARRREVFCAWYESHSRRTGNLHVVRPDELTAAVRTLPLVGTVDTPAIPGATLAGVAEVSAASVCEVVIDRAQRNLEQEPVRPVYLRAPDVSPATAAKSVLP